MRYLIPFLLLMACGATANTCNGPIAITWNERPDPPPAPPDMLASGVAQPLTNECVDAGSPDLQEKVLVVRPEELPPIVSDPAPDMAQDQDGFAPPWSEVPSL